MASEFEVDRMVVRLVGNQVEYQKMLKDVEKQTEQSAAWGERQGSRITKAFSDAFKAAQNMMTGMGSAMQKAGAASLGMSAAISAPLTKAGTDFSSYSKSITDMIRDSEKMARAAAEEQKYLLKNTEAYRQLGLVVKLTSEQAQVYAMMMERTGESMEDLTKTIRVGSAEYEKWRKEAERFGLVVGKDAVKAGEDLADSWNRVKQALQGFWNQIGASVAKRLTEFNKTIIGLVTWATKWVQSHRELIDSAMNLAQKLTYLGGILVGIGTALTTIGTFLGPLIGMITAATAAWLAWDTATGKFLNSGAGEVWEQYSEGIKKFASTVVAYGKQIIEYIDKIMGGIFNSLKAGNLELAVKIAWSGAKVAWMKSLDEMNAITGERFGAIFKNLSAGNWKAAAQAALNEIVTLWTKLLKDLDPIFTDIMVKGLEIWDTVTDALEDAWLIVQNVFEEMRAIFGDVAEWVINKWVSVRDFFEGLGSFFLATWNATFGATFAAASVFVDQFITLMGGAFKVLKTAATGLTAVIGADMGNILGGVMTAINMATKGAGDVAGGVRAIAEAGVIGPNAAIKNAMDRMSGAETSAKDVTEPTSRRDAARKANADRQAEHERKQAEKHDEMLWKQGEKQAALNERMTGYANKLIELEKERLELLAKGDADAANKLQTEEETLKKSLAQAEAKKVALDAEEARAGVAKDIVAATKAENEERLKRDQLQQQYKDRYDPINSYMKKIKELNEAFKGSERDSKVYQDALRDIRTELQETNFEVNVNFTVTGLDAVEAGSAQHRKMVNEAMERQAKMQGLLKAEAEAARRAGAAEAGPGAPAGVGPGVPGPGGPAPKDGAPAPSPGNPQQEMIIRLERIAVSTEKLANRVPISFEALALGAA
jgi:hypothetical protein